MIVIPMAGASQRFIAAGYNLPKYMLPLLGESVFAHSLRSFSKYFSTHDFLFIAGPTANAADFITAECKRLGVSRLHIETLDRTTAGQAATVELGVQAANVSKSESLTIFNIDTFRPGFHYPKSAWMETSDGYLEVFRGKGPNWSYVRPSAHHDQLIVETSEKRPISNLCCTGLYHFSKAADFLYALHQERLTPSMPELYVAPLYNHLVHIGRSIHYAVIPRRNIAFCGIPAEYEELCRNRAGSSLSWKL